MVKGEKKALLKASKIKDTDCPIVGISLSLFYKWTTEVGQSWAALQRWHSSGHTRAFTPGRSLCQHIMQTQSLPFFTCKRAVILPAPKGRSQKLNEVQYLARNGMLQTDLAAVVSCIYQYHTQGKSPNLSLGFHRCERDSYNDFIGFLWELNQLLHGKCWALIQWLDKQQMITHCPSSENHQMEVNAIILQRRVYSQEGTVTVFICKQCLDQYLLPKVIKHV